MGKPQLFEIVELLKKGENFELSNQQYKQKTRADFPKDKSYAEKRSAVAKVAAQHNYHIKIIPQRILFVKNLENN